MGTYGVTHIKKDEQIIALSDSYDGYFGGGMGQANLTCIKYLSTPILKKLFDQYTASEKISTALAKDYQADYDDDEDEPELSQRQINDALFRAKQDTNDSEVVDWLESCLSDSIRTSTAGFAPLLYLNINPHYGRDYSYFDYLVDLDSEEIVLYNGLRFSFDKIRACSINQIDAFSNQTTELLEEGDVEFIETLFDEDYKESDVQKITTISNKAIDIYLNINEEKINSYYKKINDEHARLMSSYDKNPKAGFDTDSYGGFSIHTTETDGSTMRSIVTLVQKLQISPNYEFLTSHCEWGTNEHYSEGGIRIFSPMNNNLFSHTAYSTFCDFLEREFKLRFNIFSSSGTWSSDGSHVQDQTESFSIFGDNIEGPQKSLFTIQDIEAFDDESKNIIFDGVNPYLSIHGLYSEARELILKPEVNIAHPIIWTYMALLNQDMEVFNKVYPKAKDILLQVPGDKQKEVYSKYLRSLTDSLTIDRIVEKMTSTINSTKAEDRFASFTNQLKATTFFQDVSSVMNEAEKHEYLVN